MKTVIDRFGRVVVPKTIRQGLGLEAGSELEITETGDAIVLRPTSGRPDLAVKNGILVFTGGVGDDRETLRRLRDDRLGKAGGLS